jgi:ubiquinol-cytochrome c reductase cytochrome c subunit
VSVRVVVLAAVVATALVVPSADADLVQQGKGLYGQYCIACHGANGAGTTTPRTVGGAPQRNQQIQQALAPPLRGVGALATDFYLSTGYMPLHKFGIQPRRARVLFSKQQLRALIAYVASLGGGPAIPHPHPEHGSLSAGQHLFTEHCAGCHQVAAVGGFVTGAVPPPLGPDTPVQIAEAVRIGPYVMPRFSKKAISDRQLDSIIRYVEYAKHPDDRGGLPIGHLGPIPEGMVTWFVGATALVAFCLLIGRRLRRG